MKACAACGRLYPDDAGFCPVDGGPLGSATQMPAPPSEHDRRIGELVCQRYEIRRVVADGGMGRVYEALDLQQRRSVALKILHPEIAGDEVAVERFKREFAVSRALPHDYVVEVLDFQATADDSYALVMEFLYGEELRATLKRERTVAPARMLRMLSQVAIGMDAAHAQNLVHRDLKPDNLFLCQQRDGDIAKILDFGSVKDNAENAKKLTMLGTTIGSPYYMAPEQAQGLDTLDRRADVWALAAIVYECVTGRVPFQGKNGPATLLQILTQEPEPASSAAGGQKHEVPRALDFALTKAFRKDPEQRTATAGALADAVGQAYGLEGGHLEWAVRHEKDLAAEVAERAADSRAASRSRVSPTSDFFNERGALGDSEPPQSLRVEGMPRDRRVLTRPSMLARAIPKKRATGTVIGMALAAGVVLFLLVWVFR